MSLGACSSVVQEGQVSGLCDAPQDPVLHSLQGETLAVISQIGAQMESHRAEVTALTGGFQGYEGAELKTSAGTMKLVRTPSSLGAIISMDKPEKTQYLWVKSNESAKLSEGQTCSGVNYGKDLCTENCIPAESGEIISVNIPCATPDSYITQAEKVSYGPSTVQAEQVRQNLVDVPTPQAEALIGCLRQTLEKALKPY